MTAIPAIDLEGDEQRLVSILDTVGPNGISALKLMPQLGIYADDTSSLFSGFVRFLNVEIRARQKLERHGFWLMRTGGSVDDKYWIEPMHGSSS